VFQLLISDQSRELGVPARKVDRHARRCLGLLELGENGVLVVSLGDNVYSMRSIFLSPLASNMEEASVRENGGAKDSRNRRVVFLQSLD